MILVSKRNMKNVVVTLHLVAGVRWPCTGYIGMDYMLAANMSMVTVTTDLGLISWNGVEISF